MSKGLCHVCSRSEAEPTVFPNTSTRSTLHALPDQWFRIYAHVVHFIQLEDACMLLQMGIDRRNRIFEEAHRNRIVRVGKAAGTQEIADTPFDHIGVQEHRHIYIIVCRIALQHSDT